MRNVHRLGVIIGISVAGHLLLLLGLFYLFGLIRTSSTADRIVDNRIDSPYIDAPLTVTFGDDNPAKAAIPPAPEPVHSAITTPDPPITPVVFHQPILGTNSSNATPKDDGPPHTGGPPSEGTSRESKSAAVPPLHGKFTRPGSSVVYVLDRSGSMGHQRKLQYAVALLRASFQQLNPDNRFQLVTYDSKAAITRLGDSLELTAATPANIASALTHLEDLSAEGSSRHVEGIRAGLGLHPDLIILITDADELSPQDLKSLANWNRDGTAIHAILLGVKAPTGSLRQLAGENNVHVVALPDRSAVMP